MVKRSDDARETSVGGVRDTDPKPEPGREPERDDRAVQEGRYKPEMGTIVVDRRPRRDS